MAIKIKQKPGPIDSIVVNDTMDGRRGHQRSRLLVGENVYFTGLVRLHMKDARNTAAVFVTPDEAVELGEALIRFGQQLGGKA